MQNIFKIDLKSAHHWQKESPLVGKTPSFVGHKSLGTTMRYIKIENKEQAEAIDRLEFGEAIVDTFRGVSPPSTQR